MSEFGVHSEVGKLRKVMVHRPDLSLQRLTPYEPRRAAVRRRAVGRAGPVRARPVRRADARARRRGVPALATCSPRRWRRATTRATAADRARRVRVHGRAGRSSTRSARCSPASKPDRAGHAPDRRTDRRRGRARSRRTSPRSSLIGAALDDPSTFVLPPLPNTLFTRDSSCWIYGGVSINPMYWPARRREAYNVAAIYQAHPMFADADFEFWYPHRGRRRPVRDRRLRAVVARGWRRDADRQRRRADRHERALAGPDDRADRQGAVRQGRRRPGDRLRDDQGPRPHAPRHGVHAARPRQGDRLPEGRRRHPGDQPAARHERRATSTSPSRTTSSAPSPTPSASPSCTSSRPVATRTSRSASSGTTATTSSPSSPASSSPTSATPTRSPRCARPASRSSRSRASSSARAAAAATA